MTKIIELILLSFALADFITIVRHVNCRESCGINSTCINQCDDDLTDCLIHCPCRSECPNGCDGCTGIFCQCSDPSSSEQYLQCEAYYDELYNICVYSCSTGDFVCNGNCFREYTNNLEHCPCESGCPNGCPCDVYECPMTTTEMSTTTASTTTTTATTSTKTPLPATDVLILFTNGVTNVPIITNASGRQDRNFYFLYGEDTQVHQSCSITWNNELYVFGGFSRKTQISKLVGCQLKVIGQLSFNHVFGACANVANDKIYLCFNNASSDSKKCRMATSPTGTFEEISASSYDHTSTRIAANDILALGHTTVHKKAELLRTDRNPNNWSTISEYPDEITSVTLKDSKYIRAAAVIYAEGFFYVFGSGNGASRISSIGRLDAERTIWTKAGDMLTPRHGHSVIYDGKYFIVVGGYDKYNAAFKTEKCTLDNNLMTCEAQDPELGGYYYYPELFLVPSDFCKELP